jgi:hypothetical protein
MKQHNRRLPWLVALATSAFACGPQYVYVPPTPTTTITTPGRVAAKYGVPPEASQGSVEIASYGITRIFPATDPTEHLDAIHLRIAVDNGSEEQWYLDTRQQRIVLNGRGTSAPMFASASPGWPPPVVPIAPKNTRVADLFFPLPFDLQNARVLPAFDAIWQVQLPGRTVSERTPFDRLRIEPPPIYSENDYGVNYYWGPPYWYDGDYPRFGFGGTVVVPRVYRSQPLIIRRTPNPPHFVTPPGGVHEAPPPGVH